MKWHEGGVVGGRMYIALGDVLWWPAWLVSTWWLLVEEGSHVTTCDTGLLMLERTREIT